MPNTDPRLKICQGCRSKKLKTDFATVKHTLDKLESRCRVCTRKRNKAYRERKLREDPTFRALLRRTKKNRNSRRRKEDPAFRVLVRLKTTFRVRFRELGLYKTKPGHPIKDLGCTLKELISYIEARMLPGMTWDNRAKGLWHIDHREPLCSFDLSDREQFIEAWHFTNLQPLWAEENIRKGTRWIEPEQDVRDR